MADDVTLPGVGDVVATRQLDDGSHAQVITEQSEMVTLIAVVTPVSTGPYAEGEQIGDLMLIEDLPTGMYEVTNIAAISLDQAEAVTPMLAFGYSYDAGATPGTLPGDGDTFAPDFGGGPTAGNLTMMYGKTSDWVSLPGLAGAVQAVVGTGAGRQWVAIAGTTPGATLCDLYFGAVCASAGGGDLSASMILTVQMRKVAEAADVRTFLAV